MTEHRVYTYDDPENPERACWECSCGRGGSGSADRVDLLSDRHIERPRGDHRVDTTRPW